MWACYIYIICSHLFCGGATGRVYERRARGVLIWSFLLFHVLLICRGSGHMMLPTLLFYLIDSHLREPVGSKYSHG